VHGSVLADGVVVAAGARVVGSVLGPGAVVGAGAVLDGVVVGDRAVVGARNELLAGVRVFPGVQLPDCAVRFSSDE
jgi:mannose-1-phosphate guanylyltransferase